MCIVLEEFALLGVGGASPRFQLVSVLDSREAVSHNDQCALPGQFHDFTGYPPFRFHI